jgi:Domain of unknown function (DUF2437)
MSDRFVRYATRAGAVGAGIWDQDRIQVIHEPFWDEVRPTGEWLDIAAITLLAPSRPRRILGIGLNTAATLKGREPRIPPPLFEKPVSSIAAPGSRSGCPGTPHP